MTYNPDEKIVEEALDILHECVQHTPIKLEQTNGTEYDKGYIDYQDMVVRDVLDNTPKLKKLLQNHFAQVRREVEQDLREAVEGTRKEKHDDLLSRELLEETEHSDIKWDMVDISAPTAMAYNLALDDILTIIDKQFKE